MKVLVVFVDSLGPNQVPIFGDSLDFLEHRGNLRGTMGYTCGALPSILTGASPVEHGRMCLFAKPSMNQNAPLAALSFLGLLPRLVHERGALRRRIGSLFARSQNIKGYFELYKVPPKVFTWVDAPEKEDLFQTRDIGGYPTFLAQAREAGLSVYASPWQMPERERWQHAFDHLRTFAPKLSFLYAPTLDGILHTDGLGGQRAALEASKIAGKIDRAQRILRRASTEEVVTIVVGDHGMADVRRVIDPRGAKLETLGIQHFIDSTMLRMWGSKDKLAQASRRIVDAGWGGEWIAGAQLAARGIPGSDGHAVYLLGEGSLFAPSFLGGAVRGMHGYDLTAPSSRSAVLSSSPIGAQIASTTDISAWVLANLGIENSYERSAA